MGEIAIHIAGGFLLFGAVGALCLGAGDDPRGRKLATIGHGVGLLLILLTGIGILFRGHLGFPLWIWGKLVIWLLMGAIVVLIRRAPGLRVPLFFLLPILGGIAAWLAIARPS